MKKRGFTLVEIIISLTIVAIVGVFLAAFVAPQFKIFDGFSAQGRAKNACDAVFNQVQQEIRDGKNFVTEENSFRFDKVTKNGTISREIDLNDIKGTYYPAYEDMLSLSFIVEYDKKMVVVTVEAEKKGETVYSLTQNVKCPNMQLAQS